MFNGLDYKVVGYVVIICTAYHSQHPSETVFAFIFCLSFNFYSFFILHFSFFYFFSSKFSCLQTNSRRQWQTLFWTFETFAKHQTQKIVFKNVSFIALCLRSLSVCNLSLSLSHTHAHTHKRYVKSSNNRFSIYKVSKGVSLSKF